MRSDVEKIRLLIKGMREAYKKGDNVIEYARLKSSKIETNCRNDIVSILIAYDLQSGTYIEGVKKYPLHKELRSKQLAGIINPLLSNNSSILEVGCGEATTLGGLIPYLICIPEEIFGFDISWSRIFNGYLYLAEKDIVAKLFVGDLFSIPLSSNSIDIVYSYHSLEPNRGREDEAITELLRVSNRWVVLIEPIYELASEEAKLRMDKHGYVKNLKESAERCGAKIVKYCLLESLSNVTSLNPSGLLLLEKKSDQTNNQKNRWSCPITGSPLVDDGDVFISEEMGLVYPVLRGIPLLRPEHAVVASALKKKKSN